MPRIWTWSTVLALTVGVVALVDGYAGAPTPAPASARGGATLTQPIPPATDEERAGSIRNQIGWTKAKARWGLNMPLGRDIPVAQVEARYKGNYLADTHHSDLPGTGFIPESGASAASAHATTVARHAFGPDAAGQGVRAVHGFEAGDWMRAGMLRLGTPDPPRDDLPARVYNHAWIAAANNAAPLILRRIDYLVDTRDVLVVCGVNNSNGEVPDLLASAYNVISVGLASGNSTDGLTKIEGEGRAKPEIVAPGTKTSWSCGVVTGCVAALLEVADRMHDEAPDGKGRHVLQSEVIKAVLLGGAHHPAEWAPPQGEPLDRRLGAGIVDLDRSIIMLEAGHVEPGTTTDQRYAWSFGQVEPGKQRGYAFTIDQPQGEATFTLVWHRKVLGGVTEYKNPQTGETRPRWNNADFTPNLDLFLFKTDDDGREQPVAVSNSRVDNVELIRVESLEPGDYHLRLGRFEDAVTDGWDYAVAWRIEAVE